MMTNSASFNLSEPQRERLNRAIEAAEALPVDQRESLLRAELSDDPELLEVALRLLDHLDPTAAFMNVPHDLSDKATGRMPGSKPALEQIGPYRILQQIGEGGMGVVYLAEQTEPVRRRVALKIIKLGMDSKQVLARFEAERQALAVMDHPCVAKVFDAGVTDDGRSYFVMEYVSGVPITEHCNLQRLNIEQRLELFMRVCEAVQHAHQKGIIHRDIKPGNILIGASGAPKVIDFGVAKALHQKLTERTLFTEQGQLIGTPEYMSPEQAEMTAQDIDTRSDIYSLGVLLYELLTGTLPFDPTTLRRAALSEIQRIIREKEPPRPSSRLSSLGDASATHARKRRVDTRSLARALRGDLDWITMKALEKDRNRRYETANGLAADIRRHLSHEPVLASPPSLRYRAGKFVRRNRTGVLAGVVVFATLLVGMAGTMFFMIDAQANLERFNLVAIGERLRQAEEREALLYPAWPENVQVMEDWIREEAQPLIPELSKLERGLSDFRARTTELTDAERFLSDVLQTQTIELQVFLDPEEGTLARVNAALIWAKAVGEVSITAHADSWEEARLAIRKADGVVASELYTDPTIDLRPQLGLVPIGMNPVTELWEFYHLRSAWDPASGMDPAKIPIPKHNEDGSIEVMEETGIVFVLIPGGRFQPGYYQFGTPLLAEDLGMYFLARHELTAKQWERLSGHANPSLAFSGAAFTLTHPVNQVSLRMCKKLLAEHGLVVPTEAQWELACRAGTTTPWYTGDKPESLVDYANVQDKAALVFREGWGTGESFDDGFPAGAPVGSFLANDFGLFDMHGNIEELCQNPSNSWAYLRGGSFFHPAWRARSSFRFSNDSEYFDWYVGVRALREIQK